MPSPVQLKEKITPALLEDEVPSLPPMQMKLMSQVNDLQPAINGTKPTDKINLSDKKITIEPNAVPSKEDIKAAEAEVLKRVISLDELTDRLLEKWNALEALKAKTNDPNLREYLQTQIDGIIDAYLIVLCGSFDHIELEDIFWRREALKTAVYTRAEALKDKTSLITVIVTSVVAVGCSLFAFFPGGVLGLTATTCRAAGGVGAAVGQSGNMAFQYMQTSMQAKTTVQEYFQQYFNMLLGDNKDTMQKTDQMKRQVLENLRSRNTALHQAYEVTAR